MENNHSVDHPIGNADWGKWIRWGAKEVRRKDRVVRSTSHQGCMVKKKKRRSGLRVRWACSVFFCPQSNYCSFPMGWTLLSLSLCVFSTQVDKQVKQSQRPASSHVICSFPFFSVCLCAQLYSYFSSPLCRVASRSGTVIFSNKSFCSDSCLLFCHWTITKRTAMAFVRVHVLSFSFCSVVFIQPQLFNECSSPKWSIEKEEEERRTSQEAEKKKTTEGSASILLLRVPVRSPLSVGKCCAQVNNSTINKGSIKEEIGTKTTIESSWTKSGVFPNQECRFRYQSQVVWVEYCSRSGKQVLSARDTHVHILSHT